MCLLWACFSALQSCFSCLAILTGNIHNFKRVSQPSRVSCQRGHLMAHRMRFSGVKGGGSFCTWIYLIGTLASCQWRPATVHSVGLLTEMYVIYIDALVLCQFRGVIQGWTDRRIRRKYICITLMRPKFLRDFPTKGYLKYDTSTLWCIFYVQKWFSSAQFFTCSNESFSFHFRWVLNTYN